MMNKVQLTNYRYQLRQQTLAEVEKRIPEIESEIRKELKREYLKRCLAAVCLALHDEFGFSKTRLDRVVKRVLKDCEALGENYLNYDDILDTLETETKFNIYQIEKGE